MSSLKKERKRAWKRFLKVAAVLGFVASIITIITVIPTRGTPEIRYSGGETISQKQKEEIACAFISNFGNVIYLDLKLIDNEPNTGAGNSVYPEDYWSTGWAFGNITQSEIFVHFTFSSQEKDCGDFHYFNMAFYEPEMSRYPTTKFRSEYTDDPEIPYVVYIEGYFIIDEPNTTNVGSHIHLRIREAPKPN